MGKRNSVLALMSLIETLITQAYIYETKMAARTSKRSIGDCEQLSHLSIQKLLRKSSLLSDLRQLFVSKSCLPNVFASYQEHSATVSFTLQAGQSTFRSLEMHSMRSYKIFICSVILGQRESLFVITRASENVM